MKLGFTGTRENVTDAQVALFVQLVTAAFPTELHNGCCVGADDFATLKITSMNMERILEGKSQCKIIGHPPTKSNFLSKRSLGYYDELRPELPYLVRNRNIVDETEALIAMPNDVEVLRSGTWSTVRYARKLKRPIFIIYPDGTSRVEDKAGTVFA